MNIIDSTNKDYFLRKFGGAMFLDEEGNPCLLPAVDVSGLTSISMYTQEGKVRALALQGSPEKSSKKERIFDLDFFDNMDKFKVPDLGWRQAAEGRVLVHMSRVARIYKKGVTVDGLELHWASHTRDLMDTGNISTEYYNRPNVKAHMLLKPKFLTMQEGVRRMLDGNILAFAASPNIAVVPASDNSLSILYGKNKVGDIDANARITLHIKQQVEDIL